MPMSQITETEVWKDISNYEGLYQVSSFGNVKRKKGVVIDTLGHKKPIREKLLKQISKSDYLYVCLCKDGMSTRYSVHRLVAKAFISNKEGKPDIDHINGNKSDNRVNNLRWVTKVENNNNPVSREKYLASHGRTVERIDVDGNIKEYKLIMDAELEGFNRTNIYNCCTGKMSLYRGYLWRYKGSHIKDGMTVKCEIAKQKESKKRSDSHTVERRKGDEIKIYDKLKDVEKDGFIYKCVQHCCLYPDIYKEHRGYKWRYLD